MDLMVGSLCVEYKYAGRRSMVHFARPGMDQAASGEASSALMDASSRSSDYRVQQPDEHCCAGGVHCADAGTEV
jgi:hypothetical protein